MRLSDDNRSILQVQATLTAVTDLIKKSVWFMIVYCFFTVCSVEFLHLFVIFVGEELTVFRFAWKEFEKNFENHCFRQFGMRMLVLSAILRGFFVNGFHWKGVHVVPEVGCYPC